VFLTGAPRGRDELDGDLRREHPFGAAAGIRARRAPQQVLGRAYVDLAACGALLHRAEAADHLPELPPGGGVLDCHLVRAPRGRRGAGGQAEPEQGYRLLGRRRVEFGPGLRVAEPHRGPRRHGEAGQLPAACHRPQQCGATAGRQRQHVGRRRAAVQVAGVPRRGHQDPQLAEPALRRAVGPQGRKIGARGVGGPPPAPRGHPGHRGGERAQLPCIHPAPPGALMAGRFR
jgi:hypothetical protein